MLVRRLPALLLSAVVAGALAYSAGLDVAAAKRSGDTTGVFWSDEATYHMIAHSLAFDGDLEYTGDDLQRAYAAGFTGGPSGIFLRRDAATERLYYSKAWVYSLFAAPFVRLFGDNGFFLLHGLLLAAMLACGTLYLARGGESVSAAVYTSTFVLASILPIYYFWITPEWFNVSLVFLASFFWLYKHRPRGAQPSAFDRFLEGPWTDLLAAGLYGLAVYSKPPNALLAMPIFLWLAWRREWRRAFAAGAIAALVVVGSFALTWAQIGDWNYQGGDRKTFNAQTGYPFQAPTFTFDNKGEGMTTEVSDLLQVPPASTFGRDLVFVLVGRNGGLLPYMFPGLIAVILFAGAPARLRTTPLKLVLAFFALEILAIVVVVKGNWIGGGGTIGSRYFLNAYPLLFFLIPPSPRLGGALAAWIAWALFIAGIVLDPFAASVSPARHTNGLPYVLLPTEVTILKNLPFNTNPGARRVDMTPEVSDYYAYFLDDNTYRREGALGGFWVMGGREAEIVVRAFEPLTSIDIELRNRTAPNRVSVRLGSEYRQSTIEPGGRTVMTIQPGESHRYADGPTWLYRLTVRSAAATVPSADTPGSEDHRNLGVFVRLRTTPPTPES